MTRGRILALPGTPDFGASPSHEPGPGNTWLENAAAPAYYHVGGMKIPPAVAIMPIKREVYSTKTDTVLFELTRAAGLFWVKWKEDGRTVGRELFSGSILCNDIDLGKPPEGMIATCVPLKDHATAMFVPDPQIYCRD